MDVPWNCSFPKVSERRWELRDLLRDFMPSLASFCMWAYAKGQGGEFGEENGDITLLWKGEGRHVGREHGWTRIPRLSQKLREKKS